MCLIIYKPATIEIPSTLIINGYQQNHDGWGIMFHHKNQIFAIKGFSLLDLQTEIKNLDPHLDIFVHLRKATHGSISLDNCHPFKVNPHLFLMHNGIIDIAINEDKISDTKSFVNLIATMLENYPDLIQDRGWITLIERFIADSRLVFLDRYGNNYFLNQHLWFNWCGLYLSNSQSVADNSFLVSNYHKNYPSLKWPLNLNKFVKPLRGKSEGSRLPMS